MRKVVIVDDDDGVRKVLVTVLKQAGYGVLKATNCAEGLDRLRQYRPDLVLTGFLMPDSSGLELTFALRSDPALADTPVVLMTGSLHSEASRRLASDF